MRIVLLVTSISLLVFVLWLRFISSFGRKLAAEQRRNECHITHGEENNLRRLLNHSGVSFSTTESIINDARARGMGNFDEWIDRYYGYLPETVRKGLKFNTK